MTPKTPNWDAVWKMYGAWADRDDIDDEWLNRLRGSWDSSYEALMQDTEWYSGDEKPASKNVVSIVNNGVIDINALFNHPDYKSVPTPEGETLTVHITPIADNQTPEQAEIEAFNRFLKSL